MSILTKIDSIPVFTKKSEALTWARLNGFIGYNKYTHLGELGYMPGKARAGSVYSKVYSKTITVDANHINTQVLVANPDGDGLIRNEDTIENTIFDGWQDPGSQDIQDYTGEDDTGGGETDPDGGY